jgi:hypothetical protein
VELYGRLAMPKQAMFKPFGLLSRRVGYSHSDPFHRIPRPLVTHQGTDIPMTLL